MSRPEPTTRTAAPCKGCSERFLACHGKCPKDERGEYGYGKWRAEIDKANMERKKQANRPFVQYNPFDY